MNTRQYLLLVLLMTVASFLGGAAAIFIFDGGSALAEADKVAFDTITTKQLLIEDDSGKVRIGLGVFNDAALIQLYDRSGKPCALLCSPEKGPALQLHDASGTARAELGIYEETPTLKLFDKHSIKPRISVGAAKGYPVVSLFDVDGTARAELGIYQDTPNLKLSDKSGQELAALVVEEDNAALILSDTADRTRVVLGSFKDKPVLNLLDDKGQPVFTAP